MLKNHPIGRPFFLVLVVSFLAAAGAGWSQEPLPSSGNTQDQHESNPAQEHNDPQANQRGAPEAPFVGQFQSANQHPTATDAKHEGRWYAEPEWWIASFTAALFISTTGLWVVTGYLWNETRKIGRQQADDTRILQRAFVAAIPDKIEPFHSDHDQMACNVIFKNVGHLPATKVKWFIGTKLSPAAKLEKPLKIGKLIKNLVIAPGVELRKGTTEKHLLRSEFVSHRDASGARHWLFVYGRVEYLDGFKKPRWINFCFRYSMAAAKGGLCIPIDDARYHEEGNKTDEG